MNQSTNYNFNLPEGTDLVNLLTQLIPNWSSLDTLLKGVEDQAFTNCTEVVALGVHAITRSNADGKILKWIASANYTAGDTFTVDGNLVSAATASGEALATNAIVSGAVIIAALNADESAMTVFVTGTNVASDSAKLGGELPSYYATASDMSDAQSDITDLDNLMGSTSISAIGDGTVTGAISDINTNLTELESSVSEVVSGLNLYNFGKLRVFEINGQFSVGSTTIATLNASNRPSVNLRLCVCNLSDNKVSTLIITTAGVVQIQNLDGTTGSNRTIVGSGCYMVD